MNLQKGFAILCAIIYSSISFSQNYHALAGSPCAGVEAIYHNPASSVNAAFSWDVTLFSGQASFANKAFVAENASFQSLKYGTIDYKQAKVTLTNGNQERTFNGNADFSILNFRCKLNKKNAIAFGIRGRGFLHAYADPFIYSDTISTLKSWATVNKNDPPLSGSIIHSGWLEANFNYSRVYRDNDDERISWGATLSVMKGMSALEFNPRQMSYAQAFNGRNQPYYFINGGEMTYRYTQNYDLYDTNQSPKTNFNTLLNSSHVSYGLSIGVEYVIKSSYTPTYTSWGGRDWKAKEYDWKFGVAILDIGSNSYTYGKDAADKSIPTGLVTDSLFNRYNLFKVDKMRDTLLHSYDFTQKLTGDFVIYNPTRLVLNADKNFGNNFYVNGELTINFFSTKAQSIAKTREINFLIITPRWETKGLGIYFPLQLNTQMQFWVGTAIKLGPLVVGLHDIDIFNWFNKGNHQLNGGGYVMLSVHPFGKDKEAPDCPSY